MKTVFFAFSIAAIIAATVFATLAAVKRSKANFIRFIVCCCILAVSVTGYFISLPVAHDSAADEVHVTVYPVEATSGPDITEAPSTGSPEAQTQGDYVASINSDKFHFPSCSSASQISDENKIYFTSREEAVAAGYSPCGRCNP